MLKTGNNMLTRQISRLGVFRKYSYLLYNLVRRDFTTKYRRSVLGVMWSVLNPLLMMTVMSLVFSYVFRVEIPNYPVYYLTGTIVFTFMSEATNGSLQSIVGSAGLLKKVYIPKYIFPLEKCLFALVNMVFTFVACIVLMPFLHVMPTIKALFFFVPMIYVLMFSIGFGLMLAALNVFFRDIGHLYGVVVQAWMFLTPIMYPVNMLPEEVHGFLRLNPMYHFVEMFRRLVLYSEWPTLRHNAVCAGFALIFLVLGLIVFKKSQDKFILYI